MRSLIGVLIRMSLRKNTNEDDYKRTNYSQYLSVVLCVEAVYANVFMTDLSLLAKPFI